VSVRKVNAINNGFSGINVTADKKGKSGNILIKDSHAENNAGDPTILDNHSGNGILVAMSDSVVIDHCTATNNGWDMPRTGNGPVGIWAFETNNITIQYCISYGNKTQKGAKDGGGFDFDGGITNSVIQYCLSYDNQGAGYGLFQYPGASLWHNNVVRYCISFNDATTTEGSGGIFIWNGSPDSVQLADCFIYNNLIYTTKAPAVSFEPASLHQNFVFTNNIFIGDSAIVDGPTSGEKFRGNVWWGASDALKFRSYPTMAQWSAATGQDESGKQIDPLLRGPMEVSVTDPYQLNSLAMFKLRPGSPLIDAGADVSEPAGLWLPEKDFYGTPVPQKGRVDVGIFELK
jgi:hypothetical protein